MNEKVHLGNIFKAPTWERTLGKFSLPYNKKRCQPVAGKAELHQRYDQQFIYLFYHIILYTFMSFMSWAPLPIFSSLRGWKYRAIIKVDLSFSSNLWLIGYLQPNRYSFLYKKLPLFWIRKENHITIQNLKSEGQGARRKGVNSAVVHRSIITRR